MANDLTIPDFTKEDYEDGIAPCEWLYRNRGNAFIEKRLISALQRRSKELKVDGFAALYDSYRSVMNKQNKIVVDQHTSFPDQPIELDSAGYICNVTGIYTYNANGQELTVCRHPIMPIRRLVNADTGEERVELWYKKGNQTRTMIAEKAVLASSTQILQLAAHGVMVNSENAKLLSKYIQEIENANYEAIQEQNSIGRLGWIGDHGFSPYVSDLVFDGEQNFKHIFSAVSQSGDRKRWIDAAKMVRAERGTGRLFLAASFASVILEPCGLLPFFLHAWGGTEVGKTVGLMLAASVWACPKLGEYVTTFNSTSVGQEMTASFLNSLPMCVDELQIQSSAGVKDFDKMIYQLTEGVGRTRGAKTGGLQRQNTWKCCFITTGERPISTSGSGGGAVNRIIEFETAEKIYSDLVGLCAIINENYGFAGKEFVEYLQSEGALDRVNELQKSYYRELLKSDSTDKQAASASAIIAADQIATELFFQDGNALTVEDLSAIMMKKDAVDINKRTLTYIYELTARNPMHFTAGEYGEYKAEVWGKEEDDCIYFIRSVLERELQNAGYNATAFLSWAKRNNLLLTDGDNSTRMTKTTRVSGKTMKAICVKKPDSLPLEVDLLPQAENEIPF